MVRELGVRGEMPPVGVVQGRGVSVQLLCSSFTEEMGANAIHRFRLRRGSSLRHYG